MGIVISIQQRLAKLQAQSTAARTTANSSKATAEIAFVTMAESGSIDDVTAMEHIEAFAAWRPGVSVTAGALRKFGEGENGKLFRCLQSHTTQAGWEPDHTPALWKPAGDPAEEWPQWSQPVGAGDEYDMGAKVAHNGKHWISDIDGNVWEPGVYGWSESEE